MARARQSMDENLVDGFSVPAACGAKEAPNASQRRGAYSPRVSWGPLAERARMSSRRDSRERQQRAPANLRWSISRGASRWPIGARVSLCTRTEAGRHAYCNDTGMPRPKTSKPWRLDRGARSQRLAPPFENRLPWQRSARFCDLALKIQFKMAVVKPNSRHGRWFARVSRVALQW